MRSTDDARLLREYVEKGSDGAFGLLVERHVNLVYSVALRRVGNPHQAEEVTQAVFIILAKKAATLRTEKALSSWLFQTTRLTTNNFTRSEIRRQRREQEAYMQSDFDQSGSNTWERIAPLLDDAVAALKEQERRAIILRFYEGRNLSEVGLAMATSEEAAKKRVSRALEKLHAFLLKRGIASTTDGLTRAVSARAVQAAPAALAKSVTAVAIAKGAAASTSTLSLIKGALKIMAWTKAKTAIVAGVCVLLAAGTTTIAVKKIQSPSFDAYLQDPELNDVSNAPPMVAIQPTHFSRREKQGTILGRTDGTREIGRNIQLSTAILKAYGFPSFRRMICPEDVNRKTVDYLVTVDELPQQRFQAEIKRKFGYVAHVETRETDVFLMKVKGPNAPGLTPADNSSWQEWRAKHPQTMGIHPHNITLSNFAEVCEGLVSRPIVDQTGLTGNYDFITPSFDAEHLNQVFSDQLGLELVPGREPIEMLVVEKAR